MTAEYHVVCLDAGGQTAGWLSPNCRLVTAAWEAGRFTEAQARDFARFARRHIRRGMEACTWHVVAVTDTQRAHYEQLAAEAQREAS